MNTVPDGAVTVTLSLAARTSKRSNSLAFIRMIAVRGN